MDATAGATAQSASAGVEVVYVVEGSTLETYDVNRQTGYATQQGQGITILATTGNVTVVASPNDHFLYITGYSGTEYLWVYSTDANGVPQATPIQTVSLGSSYSPLAIDPDGTVAYTTQSTLNSQGQMVVTIYALGINPATGMVRQGPVVATEPPNGPCTSGVQSPGVWLTGFNPKGSQIYYYWYCSYYDTESAAYYSRTVNQETGALGPETQLLSWGSGNNSSTNLVNVTPSSVLYFNIPNDFNYGISSLGVYPPTGGTAPLFTCTASMLEACGYATWEAPDPSGRFIFFQISADSTQIARLGLAQKEIADTGNYVDGTVMAFSPDDRLIYTLDEQLFNPWPYSIYLFDPATGGVSYTGAQIVLSAYPNQFLAALRR